MPKPQELCVVTALGQRYETWETVEVHRNTEETIDHALLTVAEISTGAKSFAALKLKPGDPAQVYLAGQKVIDGLVYLRQAAYDATSHAVQIGISSSAQPIMASSVDASPGQYKNFTLQQIASSVFGKVGVKFNIAGSPPGADKVFTRISEIVGETRFGFIERLARLRNLHMLDDGNGGITAFRGPQGDAGELKEGRNILRARLLLRNDDKADKLTMVGQTQNPSSGDVGRGATGATVAIPDAPPNRPFKMIGEDAADVKDLQMRANHQTNWMALIEVDGAITVPGWLDGNSKLWMGSVTKKITLSSPMLIPENTWQFMIKGVVHRQSSGEGTTTDILLTREDGLGTMGALNRGPTSEGPADTAPDASPTQADIISGGGTP